MPLHATLIQKLLSTSTHIGRRLTSPHLKPHLTTIRNTLPILDSDKTLITLRSALAFLSHLSSSPSSRFLFLNTNPLYDPFFHLMTVLTGHPSSLSPQAQFFRSPGFLTNPHSPKRFRGRNKRLCFAPVEKPDCVVVVDTEGKCSVVSEAERVGVPVVAIVNSGVDGRVFEKVAYPVVVGNETVEFVYLFCNLVTKTFLSTRGKGIKGVIDDFNVDLADLDGESGVLGDDMNASGGGGESGVLNAYASSGDGVLNAYASSGSGSGSNSVFGVVGDVMNDNMSGSDVLGDDMNASGSGESGVFGDDGGVMNAYTSGSGSSGVFGVVGDVMDDNMSGGGVFGEDGHVFSNNGNVDGTFGTTPTMSP